MSAIRELNDALRTTFLGGRVMLTASVAGLSVGDQLLVARKVRGFTEFTNDNDPHQEHDFGSIEHNGETYYWKIDCYNKTLDGGSEDPSDPEQTARVLTIMHRTDY